jgi:hypothetical protein
MPRKQRRLVWFILYILVVLMVVAIVLGAKDGLPGWANDAMGIGIVFFVFGSLALWVHLNTSALLDEEIERAKHDRLVITVNPPKQPSKKTRNGEGEDDSVSQDPSWSNGATHSHN